MPPDERGVARVTRNRLLARVMLRAEGELERIRADPERFVSRYVRIESGDGDLIRFRLWPAQVEALRAMARERLTIILKARQLGLTWLALAYAVWRLVTTPGYTVVALSRGEDEAKELVRRAGVILRNLPRWIAAEAGVEREGYTGPVYEIRALGVEVRWTDGGPPGRLLGEAANPNSGRSFTASLVLIDEWAAQPWAEEIWAAAYPTVARPTSGQVIGLSTWQAGTWFAEVWRAALAGRNDFHPLFLPWTADPRRDSEWYGGVARQLGARVHAEFPATAEEAMASGPAMAFPAWRPEEPYVIDSFTPPDWWRRWIGHDPGYGDPFAWLWFAAAPDGRIVVYREFARRPDDERVLYSEQAREVLRRSVLPGPPDPVTRRPAPERILYVAAGWDAFRTDPETGASIAAHYADVPGFPPLVEAPRDRAGRYAAVVEALRVQDWTEHIDGLPDHSPRLIVTRDCPRLIEALPHLALDPHHPDMVSLEPHEWTHAYDALGYGLQVWHPEASAPPPKPLTLIQRDKLRRIRGNRRLL